MEGVDETEWEPEIDPDTGQDRINLPISERIQTGIVEAAANLASCERIRHDYQVTTRVTSGEASV